MSLLGLNLKKSEITIKVESLGYKNIFLYKY